MTEIDSDRLVREILDCRRCKYLLALERVDPAGNEPVEPRPIAPAFCAQPLLLIGQAPGMEEYEKRQPFQGHAGQSIRRVLSSVGITNFERTVYSTAVVKCFPGSKRVNGHREDKVPSSGMVANCLPFLERQRQCLKPQAIVLLGGFPLKAYLKLRGQNPSISRLDTFVGQTEKWGTADVIFFPHTSGTSRWLNAAAHRQLFQRAQDLLRAVLLERKLVR